MNVRVVDPINSVILAGSDTEPVTRHKNYWDYYGILEVRGTMYPSF